MYLGAFKQRTTAFFEIRIVRQRKSSPSNVTFSWPPEAEWNF